MQNISSLHSVPVQEYARKLSTLPEQKVLKSVYCGQLHFSHFPKKPIAELAGKVKGILTVEMNLGQMVEDVRLAANGKVKVEHYGRTGGIIPSPEGVLCALEQKIIGG